MLSTLKSACRLTEQRGPNPIAREHRNSVQQAPDVLQIPGVRAAGQGDEHQALRRADGHRPQFDKPVQSGPGILARQPVQLHPGLTADLLVRRHDFAKRPPFFHHFNRVPDVDFQALHVLGPHPRQGAAHVFPKGFGDFELDPDGRPFRRAGSLGHRSLIAHLISTTPLLQVTFILPRG